MPTPTAQAPIAQTKTAPDKDRPHRLLARLPRLLRRAGHHRRCGSRNARAGRSESSGHARLPLRQGGEVSRPRLLARPPSLSHAPPRRSSQRPASTGPRTGGLRAHRMGRSAGHHRRCASRKSATSTDPSRSCPTPTPAPSASSAMARWTAASFIASAPRSSTAPSAPRPAETPCVSVYGRKLGTDTEDFRDSRFILPGERTSTATTSTCGP